MKLRETILKEHSKANCRRIVNWVGDDQKKFDELFALFLNDEYRVVQRAAWPLSYCAEAHPGFIKKHFAKLLTNLDKKNIHDAVKRNSLRLLQHVAIPGKFHGRVMDICFRYISSPEEPAAIKAFSLVILHRLSKKYPELLNELKLIIEERMDFESTAFKTHAKRILKEISFV